VVIILLCYIKDGLKFDSNRLKIAARLEKSWDIRAVEGLLVQKTILNNSLFSILIDRYILFMLD